MEQTTDIQTPTGKIYKDRAIWIGSFLGGPLVAGYLIAENFKTFNEPDKARKTWIYTIIATAVIFGGIFMIPDHVKIPNQIIPLFYSAIAYYFVKLHQGEQISSHLNSGGELHSWGRIITVGLIGLIITLISVVGFALVSDATSSVGTDTRTYGIMKHEIGFDKNNISVAEVDNIANGLTETTFFDDAVTKYVYAKKEGRTFELFISCNKSVTSSAETLAPFEQLKTDLQAVFPNNKIVLNLIVDNIDNVVKRLD